MTKRDIARKYLSEKCGGCYPFEIWKIGNYEKAKDECIFSIISSYIEIMYGFTHIIVLDKTEDFDKYISLVPSHYSISKANVNDFKFEDYDGFKIGVSKFDL